MKLTRFTNDFVISIGRMELILRNPFYASLKYQCFGVSVQNNDYAFRFYFSPVIVFTFYK